MEWDISQLGACELIDGLSIDIIGVSGFSFLVDEIDGICRQEEPQEIKTDQWTVKTPSDPTRFLSVSQTSITYPVGIGKKSPNKPRKTKEGPLIEDFRSVEMAYRYVCA